MHPYQIFDNIFGKWLRVPGVLMGVHVFDPNFRISALTILTASGTLGLAISCLYTMFVADFNMRIQSIVIFGISCEGFVKVLLAYVNRDKWLRAKNGLAKLYSANSHSDADSVMGNIARHTLRLLKALIFLYLLCQVAFSLIPLYEYFATGVFKTPLPALVPGIDTNTPLGLTVLTVCQMYLIYVAGVCLGFLDGAFAVMAFNILAFSGLIAEQVQQLNAALAKGKQAKSVAQFKFRHILLMHQEMNE